MAAAFTKYNPRDPAFIADPYPYYRRMREEDPVHWNEGAGFWTLARHADVAFLLREDRRFSKGSRNAGRFELPPGARRVGTPMLVMDPPDHTRLRNLVNKAFSPRMVERLRPRIEAITADLLDRMSGEVDLIDAFAYPLPVIVIAEMLGVPTADRKRFQEWSGAIVRGLDPVKSREVMVGMRGAQLELLDYLHGIVAERRREPADDLITDLIAVEEQGDVLTEEELVAMCRLLLVAGHETTVNLLGNGTLALLQHPDELERLRREPEPLIRTGIEELLRYSSPVQFTARTTLEEVEIGGVRIGAHQAVVGLIGAANRDPAVFEHPDELDLARDPNPHVAFGRGIHFCLGASLARLEGQIAFPALLKRFPDMHLAGEPVARPTSNLRGLAHLPIAV